MNKKVVAGGIAALVIAGVGLTIGLQPSGCPNPADIAKGGTFTATGCTYTVPNGVHITAPVIVNGGTWNDPSVTGTPGVGYGGIQPVFRIKGTHDVTLENLTVNGANPSGTYHASLVGQSGIDVLGSANVTVSHVTTNNTFGDGLTIFGLLGVGPSVNVHADYLTVNNAGRQGISPASVNGANFDHVVINHPGTGTAWDFESDLRGVGASNVTITNSSWQGITNIIEALSGPLTFDHDTGQGLVWLGAKGNTPAGTVTWTNSTLTMLANPAGRYQTAINDIAGTMTFTNDQLLRKPSVHPPTAPLWSATLGAVLTFNQSTLSAPLGTADPTSVVKVN